MLEATMRRIAAQTAQGVYADENMKLRKKYGMDDPWAFLRPWRQKDRKRRYELERGGLLVRAAEAGVKKFDELKALEQKGRRP